MNLTSNRIDLEGGLTEQPGRVLSAIKIPVKKLDVKVNGKVVKRFQAVVREDTCEVLSIVSPAYKLVPHDEAFAGLLKGLHDSGWTFHRVSMERSGAHCYVEAMNQSINLLPDSKEKLFPRLILQNSMDLRSSLKGRFGVFRLVCTNGMTVPDLRFGQLTFRAVHVGETMEGWNKFAAELEQRLKLLKQYSQKFKGMMNQAVDLETASQVLSKVVGKRQIDRVVYLWEHAPHQPKPHGTAWGLYQGMTWWLTHEATGGVYLRDLKGQKLLQLLSNRVQPAK